MLVHVFDELVGGLDQGGAGQVKVVLEVEQYSAVSLQPPVLVDQGEGEGVDVGSHGLGQDDQFHDFRSHHCSE